MVITEKRKEIGLTQVQLAERVHTAQSMICSIEKGTRKPSVALAKRIGATLDFDWTELFDDEVDLPDEWEEEEK